MTPRGGPENPLKTSRIKWRGVRAVTLGDEIVVRIRFFIGVLNMCGSFQFYLSKIVMKRPPGAAGCLVLCIPRGVCIQVLDSESCWDSGTRSRVCETQSLKTRR